MIALCTFGLGIIAGLLMLTNIPLDLNVRNLVMGIGIGLAGCSGLAALLLHIWAHPDNEFAG